jgi:ABC-type Na+ efflux pump permease subunit
MLLRTRTLLVLLLAYPLLIAALVGALLLGSGRGATIALVNEDKSGESVEINGREFSISEYLSKARNAGVDIEEMERDEAMKALDEGQVAGVLVIPQGFVARLGTQLQPSKLEFYTGDNALGTVIAQRVRGVIYNVNLTISQQLVETNAEYLQTLVTGGDVVVAGEDFDVLGLEPATELLEGSLDYIEDEDAREDVEEVIEFAEDTGIALDIADNALNAAAAPVRLKHERSEGKSPQLTARALSFALAVSVAFVCVVLVAASLAAERDERVLGRLLRGIASPTQVLCSKLLLGALAGTLFSVGLFVVFGLLAPQAWARLPVLALAVALASTAFAGLGALIATISRDARTATLVGVLIALPLVPLGVAPLPETLGAIAEWSPFSSSQRLFNAVLFESDVTASALAPLGQLIVVGLAFAVAARLTLRRLVD